MAAEQREKELQDKIKIQNQLLDGMDYIETEDDAPLVARTASKDKKVEGAALYL